MNEGSERVQESFRYTIVLEETGSPSTVFPAKATSGTQCIFVQVTKRHSTLADELQTGPFVPADAAPGWGTRLGKQCQG